MLQTMREYKRLKTIIETENYKIEMNFYKYLKIRKLIDKMYFVFGLTIYRIEFYYDLINFFGMKKLSKISTISDNPNIIMKALFENGYGEFLNKNKDKEYYNLIIKEATFYSSFGMLMSSFNKFDGFYISEFSRKSYQNKTLYDILVSKNIDKKILKQVYNKYQDEIIYSYINDNELKNNTIVEEEELNEFFFNLVYDRATNYSESDIKEILEKYFNDQDLNKVELSILSGLIVKFVDLFSIYSVEELLNQDYIKQEIKIGIYDNMLYKNIIYNEEDRKKLVLLEKWNQDTLDKYNNLDLLLERISTIYFGEELSKRINLIKTIKNKTIDELLSSEEEIKKELDELYFEYEIDNRINIINSVYEPKKEEIYIIDDLSKMDRPMMLHFFDDELTENQIESFITEKEKRKSKELGSVFKYSKEERKIEIEKLKYQLNSYKPNETVDEKLLYKTGNMVAGHKALKVNNSNQISTLIITPEQLLSCNGCVYSLNRVALGFSRETLSPELINTISDHDIQSHSGLDRVETLNSFKDLSNDFKTITSTSREENNEIVLIRNGVEQSLKPSYVFYVIDNSLEKEQKNIIEIKAKMKESGLNVPLIIFDRYTMWKNLYDSTNIMEERENKMK